MNRPTSMELEYSVSPGTRTCMRHLPLIFPHTDRGAGFVEIRKIDGKWEFRAVECSPDAVRYFWRRTDEIATVRAELIRRYHADNAAFQAGIFETLRAGACVYTDAYDAAQTLAFTLNRVAEGSIDVTDKKRAEDKGRLEFGNIWLKPDVYTHVVHSENLSSHKSRICTSCPQQIESLASKYPISRDMLDSPSIHLQPSNIITMGRPRLYHTEEERTAAKRRAKQDYYLKNKEKINEKLRHKYAASAHMKSRSRASTNDHSIPPVEPPTLGATVPVPIAAISPRTSGSSAQVMGRTTRTRATSPQGGRDAAYRPHLLDISRISDRSLGRGLYSQILQIDADLVQCTGGSFSDFFERIVHMSRPDRAIEFCEEKILEIDQILTKMTTIEAEVLQHRGVDSTLDRVREVTAVLWAVTRATEEVYSYVLEGNFIELRELFSADDSILGFGFNLSSQFLMSRMGGKPWHRTAEQEAFINKHKDAFIACIPSGVYDTVWCRVFPGWEHEWPERKRLFPDVVKLDKEQEDKVKKAIKKRRKQIKSLMRRRFGDTPTRAASTGAKFMYSVFKRHTRSLRALEIYSTNYYEERAKEKISLLFETEYGGKPGEIPDFVLRNKLTAKVFDQETDDIKEEVARLVEEDKNDHSSSTPEPGSIVQRSMDDMTYAMSTIAKAFCAATGGGPDPDRPGEIKTFSFSFGEADVKRSFMRVLPGFYADFVVPYIAHITHEIKERDARPTAQQDEEGDSSSPEVSSSGSLTPEDGTPSSSASQDDSCRADDDALPSSLSPEKTADPKEDAVAMSTDEQSPPEVAESSTLNSATPPAPVQPQLPSPAPVPQPQLSPPAPVPRPQLPSPAPVPQPQLSPLVPVPQRQLPSPAPIPQPQLSPPALISQSQIIPVSETRLTSPVPTPQPMAGNVDGSGIGRSSPMTNQVTITVEPSFFDYKQITDLPRNVVYPEAVSDSSSSGPSSPSGSSESSQQQQEWSSGGMYPVHQNGGYQFQQNGYPVQQNIGYPAQQNIGYWMQQNVGYPMQHNANYLIQPQHIAESAADHSSVPLFLPDDQDTVHGANFELFDAFLQSTGVVTGVSEFTATENEIQPSGYASEHLPAYSIGSATQQPNQASALSDGAATWQAPQDAAPRPDTSEPAAPTEGATHPQSTDGSARRGGRSRKPATWQAQANKIGGGSSKKRKADDSEGNGRVKRSKVATSNDAMSSAVRGLRQCGQETQFHALSKYEGPFPHRKMYLPSPKASAESDLNL
ncbi:hypothetical protein CONPUDRAFT_77519 [Coniophora puteana RWD-64-598 SS2]|uniref:Uncharacterized protein n=1 Tax=Coniophora puteana (strain RWD-64-598) TaxID=741705 RepID=A0A5M3M925_CONPW|nr:uncharacterized protein CONPUDRAFT_77519 [Coniophora puteana RWD-64-598 SS2]EIW75290.1 hypothetical protein CONPUDRAFT_77519 [Coniophora puteana RWD-64-598 SS2]